MLLKSDSMLLHWSDEDKVVVSEATILGKSLSFGEQLYEDLQKPYIVYWYNYLAIIMLYEQGVKYK